MPFIAFKLLATPVIISLVYIAGRRWGTSVSGFLVGLPLTAGPISFILACDFGLDFSARSASANVAAQIAICFFCLVYATTARKLDWLASAGVGVAAFLLATFILNRFDWHLLPAFGVLVLAAPLAVKLIPHHALALQPSSPPPWDLPARIVISAGFVFTLTTLGKLLGPQLSGLLAPAPIFALVFAAFAHSQQGGKAASNLLRGMASSSIGNAVFFLVVGLTLTHIGLLWTYLLAAAASVAAGGLFFLLGRSAGEPAAP